MPLLTNCTSCFIAARLARQASYCLVDPIAWGVTLWTKRFQLPQKVLQRIANHALAGWVAKGSQIVFYP